MSLFLETVNQDTWFVTSKNNCLQSCCCQTNSVAAENERGEGRGTDMEGMVGGGEGQLATQEFIIKYISHRVQTFFGVFFFI